MRCMPTFTDKRDNEEWWTCHLQWRNQPLYQPLVEVVIGVLLHMVEVGALVPLMIVICSSTSIVLDQPTKDQCWDLHRHPHDLPPRPHQRGGSNTTKGGSWFGGNRTSAHSITSMPSKPVTPVSASIPDSHLSREEIEAFQLFVSQLDTSVAPTSSFAASASGTFASTLSAFISPSQDS